MKPRCQGAKTLGHFTGFICVLDDGHDGFCEPYQAPTVDEWRATRWAKRGWQDDACRLQSELDALRAILAEATIYGDAAFGVFC